MARNSVHASGLATLALLALAAGCRSNPPPADSTVWIASEGLATDRPADVAVAPVANRSGRDDLPLEALRDELVKGLIGRLYSPIDPAYFDRRVGEASFSAGEIGAGAVLSVAILGWDTRLLAERGIVAIEGEALLLDADQPGGAPLWGVHVVRRIPVGAPTLAGEVDQAERRAAAGFAQQILGMIPERTPPGAVQ